MVAWWMVLLAGTTATQDPRWMRAVSSWVKVRPGSVQNTEQSAQLSLARGECEAIQLVGEAAEGLSVRYEPNRGRGAPLLPAMYREAFLDIETPSNSEGATGLWPDPLIPLSASFDFGSTTPAVIWAEFCAPFKQAPGTYTGVFRVSAQDKPDVEIPVELRVQAFEIPPTSSLPNSFGLSLFSVSKGHQLSPQSSEATRLVSQYAQALLRHRISPHGLSMTPPPARVQGDRVHVDFKQFDQEWGPLLDGSGTPNGARMTTLEIKLPTQGLNFDQKALYLRAIREHAHSRGWKAQPFLYAVDEPRPEQYDMVLEQSAVARRTGNVPVLVTSPFDDVLAPAADILCPTLNCFFSRPGPQTCRNVQSVAALKKKLPGTTRVWWYQSCNSHGCKTGPMRDARTEAAYRGWASYMVDHPVVLNRAMGSLAFLAGVDGELYFDTVFAYNTKDPWQSIFEFGGNGDGTLFYPGTPERLGTRHMPIESLRLKHIRDGLEDYEYFVLLEKLGDGAYARRSVQRLVRSGYDISQNPETWRAVREDMTARINTLWRRSEYARRPAVQR